jgi:hypothetical protein
MLEHPSVIHTITLIEVKLLKERKVRYGRTKYFIGSIAGF